MKDKELKDLGFKKRWLDDKSGYWFEKKLKYKDFNIIFTVDVELEYFHIDIKVYNCNYRGKLDNSGFYETVANFKLNTKTLKRKLKEYS